MNRPLTAELIRARTKTDSLHYIKKFTLCGHDLDDLRILRQMPNVEVLSLSVNKINSLKEFTHCSRLQELYVRKNSIADLSEIFFLADLPDLRVLWLSENPCAENNKHYREFVINALPNLEDLDKVPITQEERIAAASMGQQKYSPSPIKEVDTNSPPKKNSYPAEYDSGNSKQSGQGKYGSPGVSSGNKNYKNSPPPQQQQYEEGPDYNARYQEDYRPSTSPVKEARRETPNKNGINSNQLKNENVISAILILMKDLDDSGLRILRRDIDKRLTSGQYE